MPTSDDAPAGGALPAPRPRTVTIAVVLFLIGAGLRLISVVIGLTTVGPAHADALRRVKEQANGAPVNMAIVESALWTGVVVTTLVAVLFIAAFVALALVLRRGWGWARWVLLGVTVLALSWLGTLEPIAMLAVLPVVAGTVLAFLPPSLAWYRRQRIARMPERYRDFA